MNNNFRKKKTDVTCLDCEKKDTCTMFRNIIDPCEMFEQKNSKPKKHERVINLIKEKMMFERSQYYNSLRSYPFHLELEALLKEIKEELKIKE